MIFPSWAEEVKPPPQGNPAPAWEPTSSSIPAPNTDRPRKSFSWENILRSSVPAIALFLLVFLATSNWRLKGLVSERSEELREAMEKLANQNIYLDAEVTRRTREIENIKDATIIALAGLAETRDTDTGSHLRRTQLYVRSLAEAASILPKYKDELTDETIVMLYKTAPLHDIGKVGIPDSILLKPGRLTPEEFEIMKQHAVLGGKAIAEAEKQLGSSTSFLRQAREIAMTHHERWDGKGYPKGLAGKEIPLAGRIMAIADVYDALRIKRVYKEALPHEKAVEIIREGRGTQFDPELVDVFMDIRDEFQRISTELVD